MITWDPWNAQTLSHAERELRPLLLCIVSEVNRCRLDRRLEPEHQEAYTLEEIARNFTAIRICAEERPDIDLLYGTGTYPALVTISPTGRILRNLPPEQEDLFDALFESRRLLINQGASAGVAPQAPPSLHADAPQVPQHFIEGVTRALLDQIRETLQVLADPGQDLQAFQVESQMLEFLTSCAARGSEEAASMAQELLEYSMRKLWDPERGGLFLESRPEGVVGIKSLADQLGVMRALLSFAQFDIDQATRALQQMLLAVDHNFDKTQGLYAPYTGGRTALSIPNLQLVGILAQGMHAQLLPRELASNIDSMAGQLAERSCNGTGRWRAVAEPHSEAQDPVLAWVQIAAAQALMQVGAALHSDSWSREGLEALDLAIALLLDEDGALQAIPADQRLCLPRLYPLDANMGFVQACLLAARVRPEQAIYYRMLADRCAQVFMQGFGQYGSQRFLYGQGLQLLESERQQCP